MEIANARLMIADNGSDVALNSCTPAEVVLLAVEHTVNTKKYPITDLKIRPGQEAASIDKPATFYDHTDEEVITGDKRVGDKRADATYRKRTDQEEATRLKKKYGVKKFEALWPGASPSLPATFAEAEKIVANRQQTTPSLVDVTTNEATVKSDAKPNPGGPPIVPPATPPVSPITK